MAEGENPTGKINFAELRAEAERRREADKQAFQKWWNALGEERQKTYTDLRVFSSDNDHKEFVLRKCRYALEIMNSLRNSTDGRFIPMGIAIHGDLPVVYFQAAGHETQKWESFNEFVHMPPDKNGEVDSFYSDVDTGEFGVDSVKSGPFGYKLDTVETKKRIEWMR